MTTNLFFAILCMLAISMTWTFVDNPLITGGATGFFGTIIYFLGKYDDN